jgi:hypothetical protein
MLEKVKAEVQAAVSAYGNARNLEAAASDELRRATEGPDDGAGTFKAEDVARLRVQVAQRREDVMDCFRIFKRVVLEASPEFHPAFECVTRAEREPAYEGAIPWMQMDGLVFGLKLSALHEHRMKLRLAESLYALDHEPRFVSDLECDAIFLAERYHADHAEGGAGEAEALKRILGESIAPWPGINVQHERAEAAALAVRAMLTLNGRRLILYNNADEALATLLLSKAGG